MAASANPAGNHSNNNGNSKSSANGGASSSNGLENANGGAATSNGASVPENSVVAPTQAALRHNTAISVEWSPEEQSILEDLLSKYASDTNVIRYAKIAMELKDKTVRDVALRCRWMSKKENGKRRKDDNSSARKNKDRKDKGTDSLAKSSQVANRTNGPPYAQSVMSVDSDDGISYKAIGGAAGQLLERNAQALDQISSNFAAFKIHENISLFCQARENILTLLNDSDMPEIMKQMPPLPIQLNEELVNSILPRPPPPKKS